MTNFTRIAFVGFVALMASTSLTSAFERTVQVATVVDLPVLVDVVPPPLYNDPPVDDDHDLTDAFDVDDHGLADSLVDNEKADLASQNLLLACEIVDGDLVITNEGDPLPANTKVLWKALGQQGTVLLPFGLRSGQKGAIELDLDADSGNCTANVVL